MQQIPTPSEATAADQAAVTAAVQAPPEPGAPPAAPQLPAVLCVDDDQNILDGFKRHLRRNFAISTANNAAEALDLIQKKSFPIVVSDFKMPGMNGIQFLSQVRTLSPDSVRIMLTGQADTQTAMNAVNQGAIFRFLVKPCLPVILERILEAGLEQHRLITAERQLTQETLLGCVSVMVEVLSILKPEAFSRATRVRRYVKFVAEALRHADAWQWEVAAMLSQLGWITLPPHLLEQAAAGQPMSETDHALFLTHAASAARILQKVPRLDKVAKIIELHNQSFQKAKFSPNIDWKLAGEVPVGAQVLRAAIDFDALRHDGRSHVETLETMNARPGEYCPGILEILSSLESTEAMQKVEIIAMTDLAAGMIAEEDICNSTGMVLLAKGQEVTPTFAERLHNAFYGFKPGQRCRVRIPAPLS